jgi:hypothetical protein
LDGIGDGRWRCVGLRRVTCQRKKEVPIGGVHLSAEEEGEGCTPSGFRPAGPRASSGAGPDWFPQPVFHFFISFSFFSKIWFVSYLLHVPFKSIQTSF